jgi:hypothetical protein
MENMFFGTLLTRVILRMLTLVHLINIISSIQKNGQVINLLNLII